LALEFKLPDIGEGIAEGEITRWHVTEGQTVKENDPFVEVMTDKATVEIPAPAAGKIAAIKFPAGATVPVGSVIAVIETSGASAKAATAAPPAPAQASAAPRATFAAAAPASAPAISNAAAATPAVAHATSGGNGNGNGGLPGGRVLAAPAIRRRARELGIDLRQVAGSGPAGRVSGIDLEEHVKSAATARASAPASAPSRGAAATAPAVSRAIATSPSAIRTGATEERIPLRGIRKRIAERMHKSKSTAAHFTYVDEVDATNMVELRDALKADAAAKGVKLTYMPFIVQATVAALKQFPMLNATLDDEKQEIVVKNFWHVGFACDTDQGLVVPVIKDADRRSLLNLGAVVQDLSERARAAKLTLDEVTGSTFTITNAGNIGGILATPVINWPEVAILGVHKIADRAVVRNGSIVIRKMMNLSVSIDHRVVDGAVGARFMNALIELLEDPRRLLLGSL
jgi:pyruvate dehydrogenase E2 component (dihydrolipoamide acetyltransferase)